ncbi:hypothetical protein I4F81_011676 [Pyropia yezoensis]|uniref:Uncharacterized protein n=1 Tax=Pyropia yezoensis TaxID=2788 RepID=A0ACC3CGX1_PYRYE|nr:hypothetical protein I4F81_011676 [Neopyropia yezoensis]
MTLVLSSASLAARVVRQASASTIRVRLPAIAPPPRSAAVATSHSWPAATLSLPVPAAYHSWSAAATTIVARGTATGDGGTVDTARRPPGGVQTTSAAARWFSASAVGGGGGDDGGVGPGVPSATQINAALDEVNERFGEARLLLGEARDALGSVYFEEDFKDAQDAVAHAAEAWNNLLASVASQPETAAELRRSTGQKMKQLDEELRVMTDALIHDD